MSSTPERTAFEPLVDERSSVTSWGRALTGQLMRPGLLSIVDQGVVSAANFLSMVIVSREALQGETGIYHLTLMVVLAWRLVQDQMVGVPLTIYTPRFQARRQRIYSASCIVLQLLVIAVIEGLLLGGILLTEWLALDVAFRRSLILAAVAAPPLLFREFARKHCFSHFYFKTAVAIDLVASAGQLGGLWLLARSRQVDASSAVLVLGCSLLLAICCWATTRPGDFRFGMRYWSVDWLLNWSYGRWACLSQTISNSGPLFANWYVTVLHGEAVTARVGAALSMIGAINIVLVGVANWLGPYAARELKRAGAETMVRKTALVTMPLVLLMGGFAGLMYVVGDELAAFIFSEKFSGMGPTIAVASLSMTFTMFSLGAICGLSALGRSHVLLPADIVFSAMVIFHSWWMVPIWGVVGVFAANVIGAAAQGLVRWITLFVSVRRYQGKEETGEA